MKPYCSRARVRAYSNKTHPRGGWPEKCWGSQRDELSPFRVYIANCKGRKRDMNIDAEYLKQLWDGQRGLCPYTGIAMTLPETTLNRNLDTPQHASLDRVDSSLGYVRGNVEFVCQFVNLGKRDFPKAVVMKFFESVIAE